MENNYSRVPARREQGTRPSKGHKALFTLGSSVVKQGETLQEETFHNMLMLERRRAERSRKPFVLMLLDAGAFVESGTTDSVMHSVISVILKSTRETDLVGWYKKGVILGVIFTEISLESKSPITDILRSKIVNAIQTELSRKVISKLSVTVHLFPESWDRDGAEPVADARLYPDLSNGGAKKHPSLIVKRVLAIKLTSKGSVVFQQERVGQFGKRFKCLKFRSMYANNNPKIHQEYVQRFISGQAGSDNAEPGKAAVYKITDDPRVTRIGRFLRKTSLDELPQLWNVLTGEMSLVGPRPPLPYEFEIYEVWHRRRVLEVKPGVTGLWQVSGRSRTCFDDMVRLDLRYSQSWSLWLDLKILIATPRAALGGEGAY